MFDKNTIFHWLRPLGYAPAEINIDDIDDTRIYEITLEYINNAKTYGKLLINFSLPRLDEKYKRIIQVEGSSGIRDRVILHSGFPCIYADVINPSDLIIVPWYKYVLQELNRIISECLIDFHFSGNPPPEDLIESRIYKFLNTSSLIVDVDINNPIKIDNAINTICLNLPEYTMSHVSRIYKDTWLGSLDPCSTPTSDKVNLVYKMTEGTVIKDDKLVPSGKLFCKTTNDNAIAVSYLPRRSYLLRTSFENHEELVFPDIPKIHPRDNQLSGTNLLTAIMHHGTNTFNDCIAIRAGAAVNLTCKVRKNQFFRSKEPIAILVNKQDNVKPGQILCSSKEKELRMNKFPREAYVTEIKEYKVIYQGSIYNAVRIFMESIYPLQNGDKITNRSAGKGVVRLVDDSLMPLTEDGEVIDVCLGVESVFGRRSILTYWEMMASAYIADGGVVDASFKDPTPSFKQLVDMGYGKKRQLFIGGNKLNDLTFYGNVYWIRLNKHAIEMNSATGDHLIINQYDLKPDDPSVSGQRRDLAKSLALYHRGLISTLRYMAKRDSSIGIKRFYDLIGALDINGLSQERI